MAIKTLTPLAEELKIIGTLPQEKSKPQEVLKLIIDENLVEIYPNVFAALSIFLLPALNEVSQS